MNFIQKAGKGLKLIKMFSGGLKPEDVEELINIVGPFLTDENIAAFKQEATAMIKKYEADNNMELILTGQLNRQHGQDIDINFYKFDENRQMQYHASLDIDRKFIMFLLNLLLKHVSHTGTGNGAPGQ